MRAAALSQIITDYRMCACVCQVLPSLCDQMSKMRVKTQQSMEPVRKNSLINTLNNETDENTKRGQQQVCVCVSVSLTSCVFSQTLTPPSQKPHDAVALSYPTANTHT